MAQAGAEPPAGLSKTEVTMSAITAAQLAELIQRALQSQGLVLVHCDDTPRRERGIEVHRQARALNVAEQLVHFGVTTPAGSS